MKYVKHLFVVCLLTPVMLMGYSIVFVHLGPQLPEYYLDSIIQARLFNKKCPIYLIANQEALDSIEYKTDELKFDIIATESLLPAQSHKKFRKESGILTKYGNNAFWLYATERFFYLYEFIRQYVLEDVFHLENDNMLYADLGKLLPVFKKNYPGVGAVFDNDNRCIPGFMYIANKDAMRHLVTYIANKASHGFNDMEIIAQFRNKSKQKNIDNLPLIMDTYITEHGLRSTSGHHARKSELYSKNIEQFHSIFDGAAIGQYLGGAHDQRLGPGFINETCLFDPSLLKYEWHIDDEGRKVPFAVFAGKEYRINNLHIHSKKLINFKS